MVEPLLGHHVLRDVFDCVQAAFRILEKVPIFLNDSLINYFLFVLIRVKVLIWLVYLCFHLLNIWLLVLVIPILVHDPQSCYLAVIVDELLFGVVKLAVEVWVWIHQTEFSSFINRFLSKVGWQRVKSLRHIELVVVGIFCRLVDVSDLLHGVVSFPKCIWACSLVH